MRSRYGLLGCVVLVCGCVDTQMPAAPPALDAGAVPWNTPKGAIKPPLAPVAGQGGGRAALTRAGSGPNSPAATGGAGQSPQPSAAGASGSQPMEVPAKSALPSTPSPARAGDLVISELMIDPKTLTDNEGEWIELYNSMPTELELRGCELDDGSKTPHAISQAVRVPSRGYITLARHAQPGFTPSVVMSLSLTNTQDTVAVRCNGVEIDRVQYDARAGSPLESGASLSLDPGELSAEQNDPQSAWCAASESYGPELGTPGRPNAPCHPDSPDAGTSEPEPEPEPDSEQ